MTSPATPKTHTDRAQRWSALAAAAAAAAWMLAAPAAATPQEHAAPVPQQEHAAPAPQQEHAAPVAEHGQPAGDQQAQHAQPAGDQPPGQGGHAAEAHGQGGHEGEAHEAESPWALIGKLFNFAVLAGSLVYLLRSPFAAYLASRATTIRADLANAEETRVASARQLAEIEARMKALPGEIEALTERGKREIAAEEARIREAAEAERRRMIEQARREIDLQVRNAERMLRRRAGELAVETAAERVKRTIGAADHTRLVERYLDRVGAES